MRVVVADTTPVNYLIMIDQAELLSALFEKVLPKAFWEELRHAEAPTR